ncbi:MAG: ATP-dependent helicase [Acidimicrobiia bacterium]|nr:ATP-dependent helicase [Acidimicrobiia bacterium]
MAATDIDEPDADRTGTGGADVDPSQARAIEEPTVPLAVLAGPGSGKTRVLARRIAHQVATGQADSERVLAVTFTRKAAGELNTRLGATDACEHVTAGTFHALSLALLRRWYEDRGRDVPTLLERKGRILGPLLGGGAEGIAAITPIAAEIEWAKARGVPPDAYVQAVDAVDRPTPRPATEVADIYRRYEQQKRRGALMDFDDLILRCALRMENDPDFAAATRWRFRHLFVDEFQDVSPAQFRLLRAWLGDRTDLFVVGDPDQAIFSFTGADPSYLLDFADHFPGAVVVNLEQSYRCPPQILAPAPACSTAMLSTDMLSTDMLSTDMPLSAHSDPRPTTAPNPNSPSTTTRKPKPRVWLPRSWSHTATGEGGPTWRSCTARTPSRRSSRRRSRDMAFPFVCAVPDVSSNAPRFEPIWPASGRPRANSGSDSTGWRASRPRAHTPRTPSAPSTPRLSSRWVGST